MHSPLGASELESSQTWRHVVWVLLSVLLLPFLYLSRQVQLRDVGVLRGIVWGVAS